MTEKNTQQVNMLRDYLLRECAVELPTASELDVRSSIENLVRIFEGDDGLNWFVLFVGKFVLETEARDAMIVGDGPTTLSAFVVELKRIADLSDEEFAKMIKNISDSQVPENE